MTRYYDPTRLIRQVVYLPEARVYVRMRDGAARCAYTGERLGVTAEWLHRLLREGRQP